MSDIEGKVKISKYPWNVLFCSEIQNPAAAAIFYAVKYTGYMRWSGRPFHKEKNENVEHSWMEYYCLTIQGNWDILFQTNTSKWPVKRFASTPSNYSIASHLHDICELKIKPVSQWWVVLITMMQSWMIILSRVEQWCHKAPSPKGLFLSWQAKHYFGLWPAHLSSPFFRPKAPTSELAITAFSITTCFTKMNTIQQPIIAVSLC